MKKFTQYFYIFSKITTSLFLFLIIFVMGYALYTSYQNIDETANNVDNNIVMFSEDINTNKNKLNDIENQLSLNQKSIEQIKNILIENEQLAKSSNNKKEIESISILLTQLKNEIDELKIDLKKNDIETNVYSDNKFENESLINLIIIKYKNSQNIIEELNLLQSANKSKKYEHIFEKLELLQSKKFLGLQKLKDDFVISRDEYVHNRFFQNNTSVVINFFSNIVKVKPNNLTTYEDDTLNILIKAQDYLESEEILKTTETLKLIEDSEIFFLNWFNQAHLYVEFISTLREII